jgi:uncharacterized cupredoxin-like copper-binding protein
MTRPSRNWVVHFGLIAAFVTGAALLRSGPVTAATAGKVHRVTIMMKEFRFEPATIQLKAGEEVALTIKNAGSVEHEWAAGRGVVNTEAEKGYRQDLLALLKPTVTGREYELEKVSATGKNEEGEGETVKLLSSEVDVEPGGVATLHFTVPASAKGEWQMGCFIPGHYEAGMKGRLIIQ